MREKPRYYRLELDDYSAAAFTSFGKYYYGTTEDFRCFFRELTIDMSLKIPVLRRRAAKHQPLHCLQEDTVPRSRASAPQGNCHLGELRMGAH